MEKNVERTLRALSLLLFLAGVPLRLADAAEIASAQTSLAKLLEGAKGEKELNLLGGGGTWGSIEAARTLERAFNRHYGLSARISFSPGPAMPEMAVRITREFKAGQKSATDLYIGSESHFVGLSRERALTGEPEKKAMVHLPKSKIVVFPETGFRHRGAMEVEGS